MKLNVLNGAVHLFYGTRGENEGVSLHCKEHKEGNEKLLKLSKAEIENYKKRKGEEKVCVKYKFSKKKKSTEMYMKSFESQR